MFTETVDSAIHIRIYSAIDEKKESFWKEGWFENVIYEKEDQQEKWVLNGKTRWCWGNKKGQGNKYRSFFIKVSSFWFESEKRMV